MNGSASLVARGYFDASNAMAAAAAPAPYRAGCARGPEPARPDQAARRREGKEAGRLPRQRRSGEARRERDRRELVA